MEKKIDFDWSGVKQWDILPEIVVGGTMFEPGGLVTFVEPGFGSLAITIYDVNFLNFGKIRFIIENRNKLLSSIKID